MNRVFLLTTPKQAVKAKATEVLNQLTEADFQHCFQQRKSYMKRCRDRQGEYIEDEKVATVKRPTDGVPTLGPTGGPTLKTTFGIRHHLQIESIHFHCIALSIVKNSELVPALYKMDFDELEVVVAAASMLLLSTNALLDTAAIIYWKI
ncbi:hypothetical protein NQ318_001267 [Aromia moschata]|uniref:Uncharacterized protein n=1 Tax=Aromia moschata TaxID=1265417 RepID=A0AAV8ZEP0_9CUCU|nr:hypothetical protein NQ318_001267 [Aromia moschata]